MKKHDTQHLVAALLGVALATQVCAQTSEFTYQGSLSDGGAPANGVYDLKFELFDDPTAGSSSGAVTKMATFVSNGLFAVQLNFGSGPFDGTDLWLEISTVTNGGGAFDTLSPRQQITSVPYAIKAAWVDADGVTGTIGSAQIASGAITSSKLAGGSVGAVQINSAEVQRRVASTAPVGSYITAINSDGSVTTSALSTDWKLGGNSGTTAGTDFVGTTDSQALEFRVNNGRMLRLEPGYKVVVGVDGSSSNSVNSFGSSVLGGLLNDIGASGEQSVIAGGYDNDISDRVSWGAIGGGFLNKIGYDSDMSFIGGGGVNVIATNADYAVITGGQGNNVRTNSEQSTISGGGVNDIGSESPYVTIAGGYGNIIGDVARSAVIGGGFNNLVAGNSTNGTIAGGYGNSIGSSSYATIGGGTDNSISSNLWETTIGGGGANDIGPDSRFSTIGGGHDNNLGTSSISSTIAGGFANNISNGVFDCTIGGGSFNAIAAGASYSTIPGGTGNGVGASYAFAAGRRAKANHTGAFVWGDSNNSDIVSAANNSVTMRASGGYRLFSNSSTNAGVSLAAGGTAWAMISDRNAKKGFAPVDGMEVLEKLAAMPITQWHYKWETDETTPHIGPMAQDFKAAFYPGADDKVITTQEADGVALVAIQGLNEKVEARSQNAEVSIQELKAENSELRARLEKLEQLLNDKLNGGAK